MTTGYGTLGEAIVEGWLAQAQDWGGGNHWASTVLDVLLYKAPSLGWPLLREIVERAPDSAMEYIGAGPLEDLLVLHGFETIDAIEAEAGRSARFRLALAGVWRNAIPEPVWLRVLALVDDATRTALEAGERDDRPRVEVEVPGRPPTRPGDTSPEQVARRDRLLEALAANTAGRGGFPIATPVHIEVRVESGPDGDPSASSGDVLAAIAETLAVSRHEALTSDALRGVAAIGERALVRDGRCYDVFSPEPSYTVRLLPMPEEQVSVVSDPRSYEDWAAGLPGVPEEE